MLYLSPYGQDNAARNISEREGIEPPNALHANYFQDSFLDQPDPFQFPAVPGRRFIVFYIMPAHTGKAHKSAHGPIFYTTTLMPGRLSIKNSAISFTA